MRGWVAGAFLRAAVATFALSSLSCGDEKVIQTACREDQECEGGFLCEDYRCVSPESKSCTSMIDGNPILQPSPYTVSFGALDTNEAVQKIQLHNIGNCTLTLFEATMNGGAASPFSCEWCNGTFPVEIFPGRAKEIEVKFTASAVASFSDELKLLSDDREYPELRLPIHAQFNGIPALRITPDPIDFGYVAQGRQGRRFIQITNQGSGIAEMTIKAIRLESATTQDFALTAELAAPVILKPVSIDDSAIISFEAHYHPRSNAQHVVDLVVETNKGEVRMPLTGNSETPPKLVFNPPSIDLGRVPLGTTNTLPLTLLNEGGAPLSVSYAWGGPTPSTDLFATPTVIPNIAPGAYIELQVSVTATALGPISGLLTLTSNDPSKPSVTLQVLAEGIAGPGPEVVKLEMTYDNGTDNAFDKDVRNVDMTLEHPYGYVCNKQTPAPLTWGNYGTPTWISFGPKEEPERIILAGAITDGTWRVMLHYREDCSSLPTDLLAGLLGISLDALVLYLSGGVVNIPGGDVAALIKNVCLSHSSTNATVRVYVNGAIIREKTVSLAKIGDSVYALDLVRSNGTFSVP